MWSDLAMIEYVEWEFANGDSMVIHWKTEKFTNLSWVFPCQFQWNIMVIATPTLTGFGWAGICPTPRDDSTGSLMFIVNG